MGGPGGRSPHSGGLWGVSPHETKRGGELPTLATRPRVGPKTQANPKPTGVGKWGSRGRSPLAGGGMGDVPSGLTPWPQPTRVSKLGGPGARPPWQGAWGMCPQKFKRGGELPTLTTPPRVGPKTQANPKPTGVGKWGVQGGEAPIAGGYGGCPPTKPKEGTSCPH